MNGYSSSFMPISFQLTVVDLSFFISSSYFDKISTACIILIELGG